MAKFCTKCGKKLEEGKVCECTVVSQTVDTSIKGSFVECLNVFKNIFTKPFDAIKSFVIENKFIAGIIMIVATALSSGLYKLASLKSGYNAVESITSNDLTGLLNSALSGSLQAAEPEYLKEFMTRFATDLAEYAVIVFIGYLLITKLLKGKASLKQMVNVVAISLAVIFASNIINSILVFIDGEFIVNLRIYINSFASIFSTLVLYGAIKEIGGVDQNKLFVSVASISVLATIVMDLIQKLFN